MYARIPARGTIYGHHVVHALAPVSLDASLQGNQANKSHVEATGASGFIDLFLIKSDSAIQSLSHQSCDEVNVSGHFETITQ